MITSNAINIQDNRQFLKIPNLKILSKTKSKHFEIKSPTADERDEELTPRRKEEKTREMREETTAQAKRRSMKLSMEVGGGRRRRRVGE